jgi:hypothetical protein
MNSEKVQGKINNLGNYLKYCENLKQILEDSQLNNSEIKGKQIKNLQGIRNNLDELEFHLDFFDEIKGLVNNFDLENKKIEEKINKLEEKL